MPSPSSVQSKLSEAPLKGALRIAFILSVLWILAVVVWSNLCLEKFHAESPKFPFGVLTDAGGNFYLQDFSYNMIFLKGLRERLVASPYRLEDQEILMRRMVPGLPAGMAHAYSPVAFVLMLPLLNLPGNELYLFYTILGTLATLLLLYFYILPRVKTRLQLCAVAASVMGVCLTAAFITGQSTLITTPLLAAFWTLLQKSKSPPRLADDSLLALLFWVVCLKPNVALIPLFLLLGARKWRVLAMGAGLLLGTWTATAGYYGGGWRGLQDYFLLLTHYHPADFPAFMRRDIDSPLVHALAPFDTVLFLIVNITLILLRWAGRITASGHFQGAVWAFLLLSPYLLGSEHWLLVLLLVEGPFFVTATPLSAALKILLVFGILDLRLHVNSPVDFSIPCKWILGLWVALTNIPDRIRHGNSSGGLEVKRDPS